MKKCLLVILFAFSSGYIMAEEPVKKFFPYDYTEVVLDNGFKAYIIPVEGSGLVAYYSVVRTGSRDEWEEGRSGFAHFFEHMMFRGTEKYPGPVYDSLVTTLGADANAYTSSDLTVYHLKFAAEDLEKVMDLESDRFQNLSYSEEEFQTEAGAIYGEYRMGRTSPWSVLYEKLREMAFTEHTYGHTTIGYEEDIKNMPNLYEYSLSFYDRYYRPDNVVLLVAGEVDVEEAKALLEKYYGDWGSGYVKPEITPEPPQQEERFAEVEYEGKTLPIVMTAYKSDEFDPANMNYVASHTFAELAFGETSDIYKKLVLDEQKVQFISASAGFARDPYLFTITTMVKNEDDIEYVRAEIDKLIEKYKTEKVNAKQLEDLKSNKKYQFLMRLTSAAAVAGVLPMYITCTGEIKAVDEFYSTMDKVTPEDVMNSVNHYFKPERKNTVILRGKK